MKQLSIVVISLALAGCGASSGNVEDASAACVDPAKIDPMHICTMDYTPVCGCDGVTYGNACGAAGAGLLSWTPGACEAAE